MGDAYILGLVSASRTERNDRIRVVFACRSETHDQRVVGGLVYGRLIDQYRQS